MLAATSDKISFRVTKSHSTPKRGRKRRREDVTDDCSDGIGVADSFHEDTRLLCRDEELSFIKQFILDSLESCRSASLYVSGRPGTGKTACVSQANICRGNIVFFNCMENRPFEVIEQMKKFGTSKAVLVVDEMDTLDLQSVNKIFRYLAVPKSRLVLIGIGNTADFMSRFRFQPRVLQFHTYTKEQIKIILRSRTKLDETAIELCARKVAASCGDLRKALNVCRQVAETAEGQKLGNSVAVLMSFQATAPSLQSVPLHQRIILGALFVLTRKEAMKRITLGRLLDSYRQSCKRIKVGAVDESDFFSSCSLMESQGAILVGKGKEVRGKQVQLNVSQTDLVDTLTNDVLVQKILH